ncbi:pathway-specific nitrogen regulator [Apiospora saccharicola]
MPKRRPNLDFDIYVDPSCLSDSMEDETKSPQPAEVEVEQPAPEAAAPPTDIAAEETDSVPHDDAEANLIPDQGDDATPLAETTELMEVKPGHDTEGHEEEAAGDGDEVSTILPSIEDDHDLPAEDTDRYSRNSSRQHSPRTEELIQAAARDIMAEMENDGHELDHGDDSDAFHDEDETTRAADEGADSSSQQGMDEDVFSERSPRSSLGSYDGGSESAKGTTVPDNATVHTRTPRVSDISQYSSNYDNDEFVPTTSSKTRPPFRTPSDIRAMQMGSPPPSVYGTGSIPVTSQRAQNGKFPTVSRLGSPAGSQYSPKNRTPSRFKVKQEAPLILLHATLLPLRWMWAEIIDDLDSSEMSEDAKLLRDSWRLLQDCVGDTVVERGILLGHPQNDYEVLEERLLEALELPMRRRARILECGHYLGPANEKTIGEDGDSEDDHDTVRSQIKNHWCTECKHEIRYESLGPGKIFRVKVYASNGLMKAGAWAACWKEMERVDIELEPIVAPAVQDELVRLAAAREERAAAKQREFDVVSNIVHQIEEEERDQPSGLHAHLNASRHGSVDARSVYSRGRSLGGARPESSYSRKPFAEDRPESVHSFSPLAEERPNSVHSRKSVSEEQRLREQARQREIYGSPEPDYAHSEAGSPREHHREAYASKPSSPAPARDASFERKGPRHQPAQPDSLPELLLQSVRVLLRDSKNVIIITLGVIVLIFALRKAPEMMDRAEEDWFDYSSVPRVRIPEAPIHPVQMRHQEVHHHAETIELPQPIVARQAQGTQMTEPVVTYTPSVQVAATQNTPEAPGSSSSESTASESYETPVASQEEQPQATPEMAEAKTEEAEKEPEVEVVKEKKVRGSRPQETATEEAAPQETATEETATEETATQETTTQESEPLETPIVESANEETSAEELAQHPEEPAAEEKDTPAASEMHDE